MPLGLTWDRSQAVPWLSERWHCPLDVYRSCWRTLISACVVRRTQGRHWMSVVCIQQSQLPGQGESCCLLQGQFSFSFSPIPHKWTPSDPSPFVMSFQGKVCLSVQSRPTVVKPRSADWYTLCYYAYLPLRGNGALAQVLTTCRFPVDRTFTYQLDTCCFPTMR
jgi:hypothetical protein